MMEYHPKATVLQYVDERRQVLRGGRGRDEKMETDVVSGKRPRLAETQACLSVQAEGERQKQKCAIVLALCTLLYVLRNPEDEFTHTRPGRIPRAAW
jgi:hypothetical protein